ncbi:cytochrome P450 [Rhodococcus sp. ABRD24]|uniref:cytochrome P450 family protein n=1 Tax=Rhodococcus sp. ABRD24 TaxID=2507582 RepID=UPI00103E5407|nr:cytochrome P450 [Rhodococcus sp. ABRD24]QBJ96217.1 cytochrome P450 [Rhodococcus sp. ABRD24]
MTATDRGTLGRQLQMIRGLYWGYGSNGDPYPMTLCGRDDDPQLAYREMRESGVRRSRTDTWVVADHATARQVLDDPVFTRSAGRTPEWMRAAGAPPADWAEPFRGVHAASWAGEIPDVAELARRLPSVLPQTSGRLDLVRDFAWQVPWLGIVAGSCGVEALQRDAWHARVSLDAQLSPQQLAVTEEALSALPTDPELSALFAGAEMTANAIVNSILTTYAEPELAARLADDAEIAPRIVAEVLRLNPTQHLERRTATADRYLGEVMISAGDEVAIVVAAANRDPSVFTEPDRFDIDRADLNCALSPQRGHPGRLDELVSTLTTTALQAMGKVIPRLSPSGPVIRRRRSPVLRAISYCPFEF